jgi:erythritol transport system ATP-binding protein
MPNLDIAENIFAGRELVRNSVFVDRPREDSYSATALNRLRKPLPVTATVSGLSLGCRQIVEIARTIVHGAKILILDEPTSALSVTETDSLLKVIEDLKDSGVTIIYISHRLHELLHLGDYFTVLRGGRVVGEAPRDQVDHAWIVERMSGPIRQVDRQSTSSAIATPMLTVDGLSLTSATNDETAQAPITEISFCLRKGEIIGIYGLLGSGRTELLEALAGARTFLGKVVLDGSELSIRCVSDAVNAGIVLVPEDRQRDGLFPDLTIRENIAIASSNNLFLSRSTEDAQVRIVATKLNLATQNLEFPVTSLSGGNQQKVLLARCLMLSPKVLLLDEPTRGVDVGTKHEIYRILKNLAAQGLSILFASSEFEETRTLADRVLVLCKGEVVREFTQPNLTDEALFAAASPRRPEGQTSMEVRL